MLFPKTDFVAVEVFRETKIGDIELSPDAVKKIERGKVLATGPGMINERTLKHEPLDVQPGDEIFFDFMSGQELEIDGKTVLFIREAHIAAVIEP